MRGSNVFGEQVFEWKLGLEGRGQRGRGAVKRTCRQLEHRRIRAFEHIYRSLELRGVIALDAFGRVFGVITDVLTNLLTLEMLKLSAK